MSIDINGEENVVESIGEYDALMAKFDMNGKIEWYKQIGETSDDHIYATMEIDDGKIIAGGYFRNSITLENDETIKSKGGSDAILLVYNSNGEFESYKQIGGTRDDGIRTLTKSDDGGILVGGFFRSNLTLENDEIITASSQDGVILKYDSNEKLEWIQQINGNGDENVYSLLELDNGDILAATDFNNKIPLSADKNITTNGGTDGAILKIYSKEIPMVVTKQVDTVGGIDEDLIEATTATSDGGMVVAVKANDIITLEYGDKTYTTKSKYSLLVIKYNEGRQIEWIDEMNNILVDALPEESHIYAICETKNKEIIVGISNFKTLLLSNEEVIDTKPRYFDRNCCLIKYNENRGYGMV